MKKTLWLVPTLAAAAIAAGCGSRGQTVGGDGWQTCTDQQGRVVDERQCQGQGGYAPHPYRWYYYPYGGSHYPVGYGVPQGGYYSQQPYMGVATRSMGIPATGTARPASATVRGGFGSSAHGSAGE